MVWPFRSTRNPAVLEQLDERVMDLENYNRRLTGLAKQLEKNLKEFSDDDGIGRG